MSWIRASLILATFTAGAGGLLLACAEDERSDAVAPTPDASPDRDAEDAVVDAGADADARPPFVVVEEEVVCKGSPCAKEIVAGDDHFCARMDDGTVRCWGSDAFGALGRGDLPDGDGGAGWKVGTVSNLTEVVQLSAGGATTCARRKDGGVMCWGGNSSGQLGLAIERPIADLDPHPEPAPVELPPGALAARIDVGPSTACVVTASGALVCWGNNEQAQLARPDVGLGDVNGPAFADVGQLVVGRAVPATHTTLAVTKSGEIWSWGALAGSFGPLAGRVASVSPHAVPQRVVPLGGVTSFAASGWVEDFETPEPTLPRAHACAIAEGEVYCWGQTYRGALCTGTPDPSRLPAHAPNYTDVWPQQVVVADELTCLRMTDGTVQCCGDDGRGRLGTGAVASFPYESALVPATAFKGRAVQLAATNGAVCALVQGGTVECWGSNEKGELGQPTSDALDHPSPVGVRL
ncbi:MAG: hypothetical protein J0I07_34200 [Myxococcales bacterium]|nr:hypothetical protein [Myxococcales bacterium]